MSFSVSDEAGDFEYNGTSPNGLFAKRAHLVDAVVPAHGRRPRALQPRRARAARRRATTTRRCATGSSERGYSRAVRRAADRAAGVGRLVGRPGADVDASRRASWSSSSTTTACSASAAARAGGRSRGGSRALRGGARRARGATGSGSRRRSRAIARHDDHVAVTPRGGEPERFDEVVLAATPTRRWRCSPTRPTAEREILGAFPYQPNEAVLHTDRAAAAAPPPRLGELELPPARPSQPAAPTVTYHMNRLQSLDADRELLRHAQPHRRDRPEHVIRTIRLRAPGLHARRASPRRRATRDQRPPTARTTAAPTGAGASTRTASAQRRCACARAARGERL